MIPEVTSRYWTLVMRLVRNLAVRYGWPQVRGYSSVFDVAIAYASAARSHVLCCRISSKTGTSGTPLIGNSIPYYEFSGAFGAEHARANDLSESVERNGRQLLGLWA